jgi:hypothetical protein
MSEPCEYFRTITIADYAEKAFAAEEGGLLAGVGTRYARTDADTRQRLKTLGLLPADSFARARLVPVAAGKVFVRWCDRSRAGRFEDAARGAWWSSDNVADGIVEETARRFGPRGDSGVVAREVSAVHHAWSDLGGVVAVRTSWPIKALVGFGRPVITRWPGTQQPVLLGEGKDLQFMILTCWEERFRGNEFLEPLFLGQSAAFTEWWLRHDLVGRRRQAAQGAPLGAGGYPKGVVRTT